MKIAIIGYGRMGHLIEKTAIERGNEVVCVIDVDNSVEAFESQAFRSADVAIEFSTPATAVDNILKCFAAGVPVVVGTTGWTDSLPDLRAICEERRGTLLFASNFSIGVNIFRAINRRLAAIMQGFPQYSPSMVETHHVHKLDHPSGTAVTLAEEIVAENHNVKGWKEPQEGSQLPQGVMPVDHVRCGEVPGIHTITWDSPQDEIIITHSAKGREGFAQGAVLAAEWLAEHRGFHTISEVLTDITGMKGIF